MWEGGSCWCVFGCLHLPQKTSGLVFPHFCFQRRSVPGDEPRDGVRHTKQVHRLLGSDPGGDRRAVRMGIALRFSRGQAGKAQLTLYVLRSNRDGQLGSTHTVRIGLEQVVYSFSHTER